MQRLLFLALLLTVACQPTSEKQQENTAITPPNVIIFYVDDLGYGDLSSYGAVGVTTPYVDQLVENGIKFTDAHSPAATCTPSRYSLLTGEYAFRNEARVLPGDAPLLIDTVQTTMADMFKQKGYATAVVGKWHLGLGNGDVDWNKEVKPGPLELGFDYSFLLPATGDRVPTVYLENYEVVNAEENDPIEVSYKGKVGERPTGTERPDLLRYGADPQHSETIINGISRIGTMAGGKKAEWVDEEFPDVFTGKANDFIEANKDNPFFLFFSFHDIHVPRLPNERFKGKSQMGYRGDAIVQMDWMTGQIMSKLEELGIADNTLVIFTSDNGPVLDDGYADGAVEKLGAHKPAGDYRGAKYSAFEAGTRVPMVVSWPAGIKEAKTSAALISQTDIFASLAYLLNYHLGKDEAPDSQNALDALLGKDEEGVPYLLEEAETLALRMGKWKYIAPLPQDKAIPAWISDIKDIEGGLSYEPQLYNLAEDPGEENNIAEKNSEMVEKMQAKIDEIRGGGS